MNAGNVTVLVGFSTETDWGRAMMKYLRLKPVYIVGASKVGDILSRGRRCKTGLR